MKDLNNSLVEKSKVGVDRGLNLGSRLLAVASKSNNNKLNKSAFLKLVTENSGLLGTAELYRLCF